MTHKAFFDNFLRVHKTGASQHTGTDEMWVKKMRETVGDSSIGFKKRFLWGKNCSFHVQHFPGLQDRVKEALVTLFEVETL